MFDLSNKLHRSFKWLAEHHPETLLSWWPPYLGAGIRVDHVADDFRRIDVRMPLTPLNQNYVGTQFGGSLYSMCDPFYMLMLLQNLEDRYVVWDKAAEIEFRQPGRGTVHATFEIDQRQIDEVRRQVARHGDFEPTYDVDVVDGEGDVIATIEKTLHVHVEE